MDDFFATGELIELVGGYDTDTGKPGIMLVANAIQFWAVQNYRSTVREAATAFRMTDADVRRAVRAHYWMFLEGPDDDPTKQFIEHEGE